MATTRDPGRFGHVLPKFKAKTGIDVELVAPGTGQARDRGRRGDADVMFVHAKKEERLVAEGFGAKRFDVLHNDVMPVRPPPTPPDSTAGHDAVAARRDKISARLRRGVSLSAPPRSARVRACCDRQIGFPSRATDDPRPVSLGSPRAGAGASLESNRR
jgi:hypothetical protein